MRYHAHFLHTNKRDRQWVEEASQKLAQNKVKILMILNISKKKISEMLFSVKFFALLFTIILILLYFYSKIYCFNFYINIIFCFNFYLNYIFFALILILNDFFSLYFFIKFRPILFYILICIS
jgi:hypothetical protein